MAKKKVEEEVKKEIKQKTSSKPKQYLLKTLFKKKGIDDDSINEILMSNGLSGSIDEIDITLTEEAFEEVIENYNNMRL